MSKTETANISRIDIENKTLVDESAIAEGWASYTEEGGFEYDIDEVEAILLSRAIALGHMFLGVNYPHLSRRGRLRWTRCRWVRL